METIRNYDPNQARDFDYVHTIEVTVRRFDYSKSFTQKFGGNGEGFNLFEDAVESVFEMLDDGDADNDEPLIIVLANDKGDALEVDLREGMDSYHACQNFKDMVVSVKIVALESESESEE